MLVLSRLKEDKIKHKRVCMDVHQQEYELCSFAGTGRSLLSLYPNGPARHWPLLWQSSSYWRKATELSVFW